MENIIVNNDSLDFSLLTLAQPTGIQSGAYFTKINYKGKPLYLQTPKGLTKNGFIKNGKKIYTDLMFDNNDEKFILLLENLETKCQELIFEKGDLWFQKPLDKNDIESAFTSPMRVYKSGKFYLVRGNVKINTTTNIPNIKIYDENENSLTIDDITNETNIISIIEIQGIKFTSRNFQIEIEIKQIMTMNTDILFESCVIKKQGKELPNENDEKMKHLEKLSESIANEKFQNNKKDIDISIDDTKKIEKIDIETFHNHNVEEDNVKEDDIKEENNIDKLNKEEDDCEDDYDNKDEYKPILKLGDKINVSFIKKNNENTQELEELEFGINNNIEEDSTELKEIEFDNIDSLESIQLKKPNQVYYEIYKQARKKAKQAKKEAVIAFLEAKNIKKTYMLDDLDDSDDSDIDEMNYNE
jgi:hypothetical protein